VAPGTPCEALVMSHSADNPSLAYRLSLREGPEATVGSLPIDSSDPAVAVFEPGGLSSTTWLLRPRRSGLFQVTASPSGFLDTRVALEITAPGGITRHVEGDSDSPARAVFLVEEREGTAVRVFDPLGMAQDAVQVTAVTLTREPLAPPHAEGDEPTMWGLFTGVAEYPMSPLPHCDDDAENLLNALLAQGSIQRDHVILLTNEQVTRAAIRASFEAIRNRVGPEDTFIFFFSGHGGQTSRREDPEEADGMDEFICPHDTDTPGADITDDELAQWLGEIPAAVSMVLLDSCNSGGFLDDICAVPGRIGLFASEEDLLSYTYEERKAGGILAHLLARGFMGEADLDYNGAITAGELSDYLLTQMPTIRITDGDHMARQAQHPESGRTVDYGTILVELGPES
jgi:hypothetical protein